MKVLSFSYCYPSAVRPTWGVFVHQRLEALSERVSLEVVSPRPTFPVLGRLRGQAGPSCEEMDGLTVHRPRFLCFPGILKSQDARLYARGVRGWLEQACANSPPDLLDAHFIWPDGVAVSLLARELNLPYAITLRGKIYPCLEVPSQRRQCAEALRGAAAVISVSTSMADVAAELGAPPGRIHVIPNGVDMELFRPMDRADARRELGLPETGRLLVTVAHLGVRKGHREVIQALSRLPDDVRLVLVGSDPGRGRSLPMLRGMIHSLGLDGRVVLAGAQPHERIPLFLNAADVSVLASYREGCPNVVLESLACGTPVVATDVGSVAEMVQPGENGRVVPLQDVDALTEALGHLLENPPPAAAVRASRCVRSWQAVAGQVYDVLQSILASDGPEPRSTEAGSAVGHVPARMSATKRARRAGA